MFEVLKKKGGGGGVSQYSTLLSLGGGSSTEDFIRKVNLCSMPDIKDQCRGLTVTLTNAFSLGFKHIKVNV